MTLGEVNRRQKEKEEQQKEKREKKSRDVFEIMRSLKITLNGGPLQTPTVWTLRKIKESDIHSND
jgi:hypothetical protein